MNNTPILLHDHNEFLNEKTYLRGIDIFVTLITSMANVPAGLFLSLYSLFFISFIPFIPLSRLTLQCLFDYAKISCRGFCRFELIYKLYHLL